MPHGMATEPLRFPNMVTGFERNPAYAFRAALHTRYTHHDWMQNQFRLYKEVHGNKHCSESMRKDTARFMREADEKVKNGQIESGRRIGERITDTTFWRDEVASELGKLIVDMETMQDCRQNLQVTIQNLDGQLHLAQECLYYREARKGADLVHDEPETALLTEVEVIRNCQKKLEQFTGKCINQLLNGRAAQNQMELDLRNKNIALGIDHMCHAMNNFSHGLRDYDEVNTYDGRDTEVDFWAEASDGIVKMSQAERTKMNCLHNEMDAVINAVGLQTWNAWGKTNNALTRRVDELLEAKGKVQAHLYQIQQEIFGIEKELKLMQKAVRDKKSALQVAHTRLEARTRRPVGEACKDLARIRLMEEVGSIKAIVHDMQKKMQGFDAQRQQLLHIRTNLETDLKSKVNALFIDREKCLGMRRSYPIASTIKF